MTETAVCKWCNEPLSKSLGKWFVVANNRHYSDCVANSYKLHEPAEPSPAVPQHVNRPLNAADQSAINAGCDCSRKLPYYDWSHAESCPLYKTIVASSTRIDAAPAAQTVPIPEDYRQTCPLCKGVGSKEYVSFVNSGKTCVGTCPLCKGNKTVLTLDAEEATEKLIRAEATIAEHREMAGELVRIGERDDWPRWDYWLPKLRAIATGKEL